jgi:hypothetical protein
VEVARYWNARGERTSMVTGSVRRTGATAVEHPHGDLAVTDDPMKCVSACHFCPLLQPDTFS